MATVAFFSFCCNAKGGNNKVTFFCCSVVRKVMATFCFGETARKKVTTMSRVLLMWFHCSKEEGDDSLHHLLQWLCYNKMAACAFYGFVVKNVTTTMSSPSSMVMVLWKKRWLEAIFSPFFFLGGAFGLVH